MGRMSVATAAGDRPENHGTDRVEGTVLTVLNKRLLVFRTGVISIALLIAGAYRRGAESR